MNYSRVLFSIAAAGAATVSLLSLFGLLDSISWFQRNIEHLLLLIAGIILGAICAVEHRLTQVERHSRLASRRSLEDALNSIEAFLPKELRQLFSPFLDRWVTRLQDAVSSHTVLIEPVEQFPVFYIETLRTFPREVFFATSLPSNQYFWKNEAVLEAMKEFVRRGGDMTRIFFLASNDSVDESEVQSILLSQVRAGIGVISVQSRDLPSEWRQLFVVSQSTNLAWVARTAADTPDIESTYATADPKLIDNLRMVFGSLLGHPSAREWYEVGDGELRSRQVDTGFRRALGYTRPRPTSRA